MKGLEVSEIQYSYVKNQSDIFRLDSYYYSKEFLSDENVIALFANKSLKELNARILSFGAYSLNNYVEYKNEGIPFIRGVNMKKGFLDFSDTIFIDDIAHKLLWKSEVKPNTILLSMSGTIGDVAIAIPDYKYPMNSNQDIAKISLNGGLNSYYLYTFLLSKFGQNYLKREARGSVQQHVFLSQIENIRIPLLSDAFQSLIEKIVLSAHSNLIQSKQLFSAAEEQLLSELGLKDWQPENQNINVKTLSESFLSSGRLDAEYYQSKYDEIRNRLKSYYNGYLNLFEIANTYRGNFISEDLYCDDNNCRAYIRGADISSNNLSSDKFVYIDNVFVAKNEICCLLDDIVIALIGSVGTAARITDEYVGSYISNNLGLIRIKSKLVKSEYLHLFLTSNSIGKYLFEQIEMRTAQPKISDKDIWDFPIPLLPMSIQEEISAKIQKSFALKAESKRLLEQAKLMVEQEIEKGGE